MSKICSFRFFMFCRTLLALSSVAHLSLFNYFTRKTYVSWETVGYKSDIDK
jgi:hypothetical protein